MSTVEGLVGLEAHAATVLSDAGRRYFERGSGAGLTARDNVAAWDRLVLVPHVLRDVSRIRTATTVLGADLATPVLVAPTAMHRFATDEGERATVRGAAAAGSLLVVSMAATTSLEDVAAAAPEAPRWAQMYMLADRGRTRALAERARHAGYGAIVASVDGGSVPHGAERRTEPPEVPPSFRFPNLAPAGGADDPDLMRMVNDFDPTLTFDDLARFGEWSGLPVVVKGVLQADDARRCIDAGARAIAVSNHGGRMVDGTVATADVLAGIVDAVGTAGEVYVDGGLRDGTAVVKALALGARAVMIGRPVLWGLALDGADGVTAVLDAYTDDVRRTMAFCGAATVDDLGPDLVART